MAEPLILGQAPLATFFRNSVVYDAGTAGEPFAIFEKLVKQWNTISAEYTKAVENMEATKNNVRVKAKAQREAQQKLEELAAIKAQIDQLVLDSGRPRGSLDSSLVVGYLEKP